MMGGIRAYRVHPYEARTESELRRKGLSKYKCRWQPASRLSLVLLRSLSNMMDP